MLRQRFQKLLPVSDREDTTRLTHRLAAAAVLAMATIAPTAQALAAPAPEPASAVAPAEASAVAPAPQIAP